MRFSEPGMHTRGHASDKAWSRHMRRLAKQLASEPEDTRSRMERMIQKAQGHPDRAAQKIRLGV
jgi:hypothetical protein